MGNSPATILTLDAGGTNFVFSAVRDFSQVVAPVTYPSYSDDLDKCLKSIISGFEEVAGNCKAFDAISFAFPGPADYNKGIIGNLPNFRAFNGDVALGPMLEQHFRVPVFINNDGNLFAAGVARAGYLPKLNKRLQEAGSSRQFRNLIGITLGTGFGCGIVCGGEVITGDNSCGAEIHNTLNPFNPKWNAEESVSTRAIRREYSRLSGLSHDGLMPRDIYEIAKGKRKGDAAAAQGSFEEYGKALGGSIANVLTLIDGVVVIGGGLSAAWDLFSPAMFRELERHYENHLGERSERLSFRVFNLEDPAVFAEFAGGEVRRIRIPGTNQNVEYDAMARTGVALSDIDGSLAISMGAYDFALRRLGR